MNEYTPPSIEVLGQLHDLTLSKVPGKPFAPKTDGLFQQVHGHLIPLHS